MTEPPDLDLVRTPDEKPVLDPAPRSTGPWPLLAILVAIIVVIGGGYFLVNDRLAPAPPAETADAPPSAPVAAPPEPLGGDPFPADVPSLDASDSFVRQWLPRLSSHPRIAAWLATDRLIRGFATVVSNIAEGKTPAGHLAVLKPAGAIRVIERDGKMYIDPRSYERYNDVAAAFASLDPAGSAQLYSTLKPRIEEATGELGAAPGTFDRTLERAFVLLLQTPISDRPLQVEPSGIGYRFADPRLEALNGAQKQLLRMGPANARLVQRTLRDLAATLGIPVTRLPAPSAS